MPRRVVQLINSLGQGGAERLLVDLAAHWDPARYEVHIVALMDRTPHIRGLKDCGAPIEILGLRGPWDLAGWHRCRARLDELQPDILHTHLMLADIMGWRYGRGRPDLPVATTFHSPAEHYLGPPSGMPRPRQTLFRSLAMQAKAAWIACSEPVAESFDEHSRWTAPMRVVENAIDCSRFDAEGADASELRASLGVKPDDTLLLTVARLTAPKGHRVLLRALAELRDGTVVSCWVGDGPEAQALGQMARSLEVQQRLRLVGSQDDVAGYFRAADLFVLPSLREGMPLALLEAMTSGVPVVATRTCGLASEIEQSGSGIIVECGDHKALAAGLSKMIADPELRRTAGANGRELAIAKYNAPIGAAAHMELYDKLVDQWPELS